MFLDVTQLRIRRNGNGDREISFREIPFGDFVAVVNVGKNRVWKHSTEEFPLEGKPLSLHVHMCRVQLRNSLEEKSVIHYCKLRGDML